MKGQGMFRRMADSFNRAIGRPVTHKLPTPEFSTVKRSVRSKPKIVRSRRPLPCKPGTIVYQDWLVKEFGYDRRLADGYLYAYRNGYKVKMPMPGDLI